MSAIESLLGPRPGPLTVDHAPRTLLHGDDVLSRMWHAGLEASHAL